MQSLHYVCNNEETTFHREQQISVGEKHRALINRYDCLRRVVIADESSIYTRDDHCRRIRNLSYF